MEIVWFLAIVVFGIIEATTAQFVSIWFAGGALTAFVAALLSASGWLQIILFVVISALLLLFTRPLAVKFINKGALKTNYESMVGRVGEVVEQIDNLRATGCVRVSGQDWTARAAADLESIPVGCEVVVQKIEGVKLIVAPVKKEETA